jgi:hypothetical protein
MQDTPGGWSCKLSASLVKTGMFPEFLYFNQTRDEVQLEFLYSLACFLVKIKSSTAFFGVPTGAQTVLWIPQFGVIL